MGDSKPVYIPEDASLYNEYKYDGRYCGKCALCCTQSVIPLHPEVDNLDAFDKVLASEDPEVWVIRQLPNGDCCYLVDGKCTTHDNLPALCSSFDCRLAIFHERAKPGSKNMYSKEIYKKGKIMNRKHPLDLYGEIRASHEV